MVVFCCDIHSSISPLSASSGSTISMVSSALEKGSVWSVCRCLTMVLLSTTTLLGRATGSRIRL